VHDQFKAFKHSHNILSCDVFKYKRWPQEFHVDKLNHVKDIPMASLNSEEDDVNQENISENDGKSVASSEDYYL